MGMPGLGKENKFLRKLEDVCKVADGIPRTSKGSEHRREIV